MPRTQSLVRSPDVARSSPRTSNPSFLVYGISSRTYPMIPWEFNSNGVNRTPNAYFIKPWASTNAFEYVVLPSPENNRSLSPPFEQAKTVPLTPEILQPEKVKSMLSTTHDPDHPDHDNKVPSPSARPHFDWKQSGLENPLAGKTRHRCCRLRIHPSSEH